VSGRSIIPLDLAGRFGRVRAERARTLVVQTRPERIAAARTEVSVPMKNLNPSR
jgi:hypothetical protein